VTTPIDATELGLLRAKDHGAFHRLVKTHHRVLIAVARGIVGASEAEEVVQIAWIKAFDALPSFEGRAALRTWLSRIVMNEARMQRRSRRREVFLEDLGAADDPLDHRFAPDGHWSQPPTDWHSGDPASLLSADALQQCLDKLMVSMPELQRILVELRDMAGLEFAEICNTLDISASNARVLLHRGRLRVFKMVDHFQETGEC
jgi:RNA polymerase sigma-70 factor, ECF subfamily